MNGSLASVVIPAHNEARGISRTLAALADGLDPGQLEIVVVCNGCTDDTAQVVRRRFPHVRVLQIPEASKTDAVDLGNEVATVFPRVHLDADVIISGRSVAALVGALDGPILASGPRRVIQTGGSGSVVRSYYYVWERLPQVQAGLFGRGVFALSEHGQARVSSLPRLMGDDLVVSTAFEPRERVIVEAAEVLVAPPRELRGLVRRRTRVATGNAQAMRSGMEAEPTSLRSLLDIAAHDPGAAIRMPAFLGVTIAARLGSRRAIRRGDFTTWLRDESSRVA